MKIIKVPGINGVGLNKTKGCEKAPEKIIEFLGEIYTNESGVPIDVSLIDFYDIKLENNDLKKENRIIYDSALGFFRNNKKTFFIGGDHSISYSLTRAFFDYCHSSEDDSGKIKEPCLIVFDAHPDLMQPVDSGIPTHEEWLNQLISDGFPLKNILLIGLRNSAKEELGFIQKNKITCMSIDSFLENLSESCEVLMEFASGKELYISIDIDVLDPAFAPATGYKEPGGFSSREFLYLIKRINKMKNLRAIDLTEINSKKDEKYDFATTKLGSKILSEFF
ncbi:MAG: arginase family protein [Minisyncoccales bacterium]